MGTNSGTSGTKEISKNWPNISDDGIEADDYHEGRQINLVAEGLNGVKSTTPQKDSVGL